MILAVGGIVVCLSLPSLTNNRVSFSETKFGLMTACAIFLIGVLITNFSMILLFKARKEARAAAYKSELESEIIVLFDGDTRGWITYRNFHRPGSSSLYRKVGFGGLIALTRKRLVALNGSNPMIDVLLTDERLRQMKFSLEGEKTLLVAFDANLFQPEWSGAIEYRFKTAQAREFSQKLGEATR